METVKMTRERSEWSISEILRELGISRRSYYRWAKEIKSVGGQNSGDKRWNIYKLLPEEHNLIIKWAITWSNLGHRELAWRLVDEGIVCISPSVIYSVLKGAGLIKRWSQPDARNYRPDDEKAQRANERWQTDISYLRIVRRHYYLVFFMDEYSRYIVHWELLLNMDGNSVEIAAQVVLDKCNGIELPPEIQSDNGSAYISREFKIVLSQMGVGHHRIHPHCPEENGIIERTIRTDKGEYIQLEFDNLEDARDRIGNIVRWYNEERLYSALHFLRPLDYYSCKPEELLEIRKQKLISARQRRKEENLKAKMTLQPELSTITSAEHTSFDEKLCSSEAHVDNSLDISSGGKTCTEEEGVNRNFSEGQICATLR